MMGIEIIPKGIRILAAEALSGYNDGWTKQTSLKRLEEINHYIAWVLKEDPAIPKTENVPAVIIDLAGEATSDHNDGWAKENYEKHLRIIKTYIDGVL